MEHRYKEHFIPKHKVRYNNNFVIKELQWNTDITTGCKDRFVITIKEFITGISAFNCIIYIQCTYIHVHTQTKTAILYSTENRINILTDYTVYLLLLSVSLSYIAERERGREGGGREGGREEREGGRGRERGRGREEGERERERGRGEGER